MTLINVALQSNGSIASASDYWDGFAPDGRINNGILIGNEGWHSKTGSGDKWVKIELKNIYPVSIFKIYSTNRDTSYFPKNFSIEVSINDVSYTTVYTSSGDVTNIWNSTDTQNNEIKISSTNAKYIKLYMPSVSYYIYINEFEIYTNTSKFLIKQGTSFYSIKPEFYDDTTSHNFTPLSLTSGNAYPNANDYTNNGFDDVSTLCTSTTVGSDTFRPVDKFGETKVTGATFTTADNKTYTVNPNTNVSFKQGSVICYSDGNVVTPDNIDYVNGTVTFNTAQTGTMTFDYIYMYKFKIMMYRPS